MTRFFRGIARSEGTAERRRDAEPGAWAAARGATTTRDRDLEIAPTTMRNRDLEIAPTTMRNRDLEIAPTRRIALS
jgi:hypothetical protein